MRLRPDCIFPDRLTGRCQTVRCATRIEESNSRCPGYDRMGECRALTYEIQLPVLNQSKCLPIRKLIGHIAAGGGDWRGYRALQPPLRGLRRYVALPHRARQRVRRRPRLISDLAAVVTVTDDGVVRAAAPGLQYAAPGDLRNCMVALTEEEHLLAGFSTPFYRRRGSGRA